MEKYLLIYAISYGDACRLGLGHNPIGFRGGRAIMQTLNSSKHEHLEITMDGCDLTAGVTPDAGGGSDAGSSSLVFDRARPNGSYR
eukprot:COSAG05_NODE_2275_length_3297_cov_87.259225_2_plen_86_part_00